MILYLRLQNILHIKDNLPKINFTSVYLRFIFKIQVSIYLRDCKIQDNEPHVSILFWDFLNSNNGYYGIYIIFPQIRCRIEIFNRKGKRV